MPTAAHVTVTTMNEVVKYLYSNSKSGALALPCAHTAELKQAVETVR
jgi:hypothetical protein